MQTQTSPAPMTEAAAREDFRSKNGVKLVEKAQAGESAQKLPAGLYGFSYTPFGTETPLFHTHPVDSFEVHTMEGGELLVVCFATATVAGSVNSGVETEMLELFPEIFEAANVPVLAPISRMAGAKPLVRDKRNCLRVRMIAK
jgi:hypothetical protein